MSNLLRRDDGGVTEVLILDGDSKNLEQMRLGGFNWFIGLFGLFGFWVEQN
jgi:hypothetical protein